MRFIIAGLVSVAGLVSIRGWLGDPPQAPPRLVAEPATLDFGEAWGQSDFHWRIRVRNPSFTPLNCQELRAGCSCVKFSPRSFIVPAGGTQNIDLILDLREKGSRSGADHSQQELTPFSVALAPVCANADTPHDRWFVTGQIRHPFVGLPRVWDVGTISADKLSDTEFQLPVVCMRGIAIGRAECGEESGTAQVSQDEAGLPGVALRLSQRPLGHFEFPLQIQATATNGILLPPTVIKVAGRVVGDVETYPAAAALGLLRTGQLPESTVLIRSRSGQQLHVDHITCSDKLVEVIPSDRDRTTRDGALAYTVKAKSAQPPGTYSATVDFDVAAHNRKPERVSYRITYSVCEHVH